MKHFPLTPVIGHRGVPTRVAENSLAGLRLAATLGYRWCEIDVQVSADGVAVLHHDFALLATGKQLHEYIWEELRVMVIGEHPDTGEQLFLPSLRDALVVAHDVGLGLVLELKARGWQAAMVAQQTVRACATAPAAPFMVASFSDEALSVYAMLAPDVALALNTGKLPKQVPPLVRNVHFDYRQAQPALLAYLKEAGLGLYAYTVNDIVTRDRLYAMGVDGVFTDYPELLAGIAK